MESNYSRCTGKTTRLIDEAIEELFEKGFILVPKRYINGPEIAGIKERLFLDHAAWRSYVAQTVFITKLLKRLSFEHDGFYKVDDKKGKTIIKITVVDHGAKNKN